MGLDRTSPPTAVSLPVYCRAQTSDAEASGLKSSCSVFLGEIHQQASQEFKEKRRTNAKSAGIFRQSTLV